MSTGWPSWDRAEPSTEGTAWPVDPDPWTGPAWAAPERVERWARRPSPWGTLSRADHDVIAALNDRLITPEQFCAAWRVLVLSKRK